MAFTTKPKGDHANFAIDCPRCPGEFTVTNGYHDPHTCQRERPVTLDDLQFPEPTE